MLLSLIVACDKNQVIGRNGTLPWHLPRDLQRFKDITIGKSIIMGRKTHDSIGRALPGRKNLVLTSQPANSYQDCFVYADLKTALKSVKTETEVFVIGGETVYLESLPFAGRIYMTEIAGVVDGDVFFPAVDLSEWDEVIIATHVPDFQHEYGFSFKVLNRKV